MPDKAIWCSICGTPLSHIDEACPKCLPNFYQKYPRERYGDTTRCYTDNPEVLRLREINSDLLKALERVMSYPAVRNALECDDNDMARAAIAKATG